MPRRLSSSRASTNADSSAVFIIAWSLRTRAIIASRVRCSPPTFQRLTGSGIRQHMDGEVEKATDGADAGGRTTCRCRGLGARNEPCRAVHLNTGDDGTPLVAHPRAALGFPLSVLAALGAVGGAFDVGLPVDTAPGRAVTPGARPPGAGSRPVRGRGRRRRPTSGGYRRRGRRRAPGPRSGPRR